MVIISQALIKSGLMMMFSICFIWLKSDPGVRRQCNEQLKRGNSFGGYKRVARPVSRGPTGPLITFPLWTRPSVVSNDL